MADDSEGLAGRRPEGMFPGFLRPLFADAWGLAVAGYVLAMFVYLGGFWLAVLAESHARQSFRDFLGQLVSHHFDVLAPALLLGVALVALAPRRAAGGTRTAALVDAGLVAMVLLAVIIVVGDLLGLVIDLSFAGHGFAGFVSEFSIHLGALLVGAAAGLWALSELDGHRSRGTAPS